MTQVVGTEASEWDARHYVAHEVAKTLIEASDVETVRNLMLEGRNEGGIVTDTSVEAWAKDMLDVIEADEGLESSIEAWYSSL